MLLQTYLVTVAIHWQDEPQSVTERYERLEKPRYLAQSYDLFGRGATSGDRCSANLPDFPLRFDQPKVATLIGTSRKVIPCLAIPKLWTT